jgi:hypothetical protein
VSAYFGISAPMDRPADISMKLQNGNQKAISQKRVVDAIDKLVATIA